MNELTSSHQIIRSKEGAPLFVLVPWDEYQELMHEEGRPDEEVEFPIEVVELNLQQGFPLIRAWREYLGLTQQQVADRMGIKQSSYAAMEAEGANPPTTTLKKIAMAMGVEWEQLRDD